MDVDPWPGGAGHHDVELLGSHLHHVEVGTGPVVLFLHGNPTSSFLWRHVLGPVAATGWRCVALDLVGMGRSGKPRLDYRLADHARFLDAWLEAAGIRPHVIVGHDWGAVLAIDLLGRRPESLRGVAFLEGHLHPIASWDDLDPGARDLFGALRTPSVGERMVFRDNVMIEAVLPAGVMRTLGAEELDAYRRPFLRPEDRLPMLAWTREIPIAGEPAGVVDVVTRNQRTLTTSPVPKLLLHGTPGAVVGEAEVEWCSRHGRALTVTDVGPGIHFLPEDRPDALAAAITHWLGSAL